MEHCTFKPQINKNPNQEKFDPLKEISQQSNKIKKCLLDVEIMISPKQV